MSKETMISYGYADKACDNRGRSGYKICHVDWPSNEFIYRAVEGEFWKDQGGIEFQASFHDIHKWEEYKEPKKKVKMYYPKAFRDSSGFVRPSDPSGAYEFHKTNFILTEGIKEFVAWHEIDVEI